MRSAVLNHLGRFPESLLVVEEWDKLRCSSRGLLRQLLDKGGTANFSFARSIVVLEANTGSAHLHKLLQEAGSRSRLTAELAQRSLKDVVFSAWSGDGCETAVVRDSVRDLRSSLDTSQDSQKTLSLVNLFLPFLPLERRHLRTVLETQLRERRRLGAVNQEFRSLVWGGEVLDFLLHKIEFERGVNADYAVEGAKEAPVVVSRHVSRALRRWAVSHASSAAEPAAAALRLFVNNASEDDDRDELVIRVLQT